MTPYTLRFISKCDQQLFASVRSLVERLPDGLDLGTDKKGRAIELSCHVLARAFANLFPQLECVDGYFYRSFDHSWLLSREFALIDPYPVGIVGGPIMLHDYPGHILRPSAMLYRENDDVMKHVIQRTGRKEFQKAVWTVEQELRRLHHA